MDLGQAVWRVEQVGDGDATECVSSRHPDADLDGLGDVVAAGADVERPADAALQLRESRRLVPAPPITTLAGLRVECEGFRAASNRILIAKGYAESAGL